MQVELVAAFKCIQISSLFHFVKAHKKAKERVERLKQLMEEEEESHKAFTNTVIGSIESKQHKCTRAEARIQKFRQSVAHGTQRMQGKLEVSLQASAEELASPR